MKAFITYLFFFSFLFTQTFSDISFYGARSIGLSGSNVANPTSDESTFYNPAGLVELDKFSVFIGTTDLYTLDFLQHQFISISFPFYFSSIAISYQELSTTYTDDSEEFGSFDGDLSNERQISFSQGYSLLNDKNSTLSIGYNINYFITQQAPSAGPNGDGINGLPELESKSMGLDIGVYSSLRNKISFGAFIKNINSPKISKGSSMVYFPRKWNLGIGYMPFTELKTNFSVERVFGTDSSSFRFGFEYFISQNFTFRSGIQINPNRIGFGFSSNLRFIQITYGILTHPVFKVTNAIDIKVNIGKN